MVEKNIETFENNAARLITADNSVVTSFFPSEVLPSKRCRMDDDYRHTIHWRVIEQFYVFINKHIRKDKQTVRFQLDYN